MRKVLSSLRSQVDARLAPCGMTYVQWLPLYKLLLLGDCSAAHLARELEMDPGALTRAIDRLATKGLVQRTRCAQDRRVVQLALTPAGQRAAAQVPAVLTEVLDAHLQGITAAEQALLQQLLGRMWANGEALRQAGRD